VSSECRGAAHPQPRAVDGLRAKAAPRPLAVRQASLTSGGDFRAAKALSLIA
jgi:hypothetical protein